MGLLVAALHPRRALVHRARTPAPEGSRRQSRRALRSARPRRRGRPLRARMQGRPHRSARRWQSHPHRLQDRSGAELARCRGRFCAAIAARGGDRRSRWFRRAWRRGRRGTRLLAACRRRGRGRGEADRRRHRSGPCHRRGGDGRSARADRPFRPRRDALPVAAPSRSCAAVHRLRASRAGQGMVARGRERMIRDPAGHAAEQQRQATDGRRSVWVAASAGTGKTKVLTDRGPNLMLRGSNPGRILCLTFTKAAAAEMANRINNRLSDWATLGDGALAQELLALTGMLPDRALMEDARRLFARVLDTPGGMKILTIHAFCQSLLRRFPIEADIAPHFEVMDERNAAEILGEAREAVLATARSGSDPELAEALAEVTLHLPEQGFAELLAALSLERPRLQRPVPRDRRAGPAGGCAPPAVRTLQDAPCQARL